MGRVFWRQKTFLTCLLILIGVAPSENSMHGAPARQKKSSKGPQAAVLISANAEWRAVKPLFAVAQIETSPYGEYFFADIGGERVLFFHGGWGKVAAAGSTQYV